MECCVCYEPFMETRADSGSGAGFGGAENPLNYDTVIPATATSQSTGVYGVPRASGSSAGIGIMCSSTSVSTTAPGPSKKRKMTPAIIRKMSDLICTPCGHLFHRACITGWLEIGRGPTTSSTAKTASSGACPICRQKFRVSQLYPVYLDGERSAPQPDVSQQTGDGNVSPAVLDVVDSVILDVNQNATATGTTNAPNNCATCVSSECEKSECVDAKLFLQLARRDCDYMQVKIQEWIQKYEEAVELATLKQIEMDNLQTELRRITQRFAPPQTE